jgi:hypothetical protein
MVDIKGEKEVRYRAIKKTKLETDLNSLCDGHPCMHTISIPLPLLRMLLLFTYSYLLHYVC